MLLTLIHRATAISNHENIPGELEFLPSIFTENGYSDKQIQHALNLCSREDAPREEPTSVSLHFVGSIFNCFSRVLMTHNIKTVGLPPRKVTSFLRPIEDDGFKIPSIYRASPENVMRSTLVKLPIPLRP